MDTTVPLAHQTRYWLNLNYAAIVKQDIHELLTTGIIKAIKEAIWLSSIVVVPKKHGKLRICVDFRKLNVATKKDFYPLPFIDEVVNIVVGHEVYTFLDGFSRD